MLRISILGLLLFFFSAYVPTVYSQEPANNVLNQEVKDAIYALQHQFNNNDAPFIRFFSTYAIPEDKREAHILTASFLLHSLVGPAGDNEDANAGSYYPLALRQDKKLVPFHLAQGSKTLWWIDLRNFNFTAQAWETTASVDAFFVEPIVHHKENGLLRLLAGNAVLRMDWFIYYASDIDRQVSAGRNIKIYNTLLYANAKEPKNVQDFEKLWGISEDEARKIGNEDSALVIESKNVALHNRMMFHYRSPLGWLYRTYDVLNEEGVRDYLQSIPDFKGKPPPKGSFDAGEIFATNQLKMQVYGLYDGQEKIVDFADSRAVRDLNDIVGNPTVRVAHGCFSCHSAGPLFTENALREYLDARMKLYTPNKGDSLRIERSLLAGKFEDAITEDETAYAKALLKVNGLTPQENLKNYLQVIQDYNAPLGMTDVARECGVTEAKILEAAQGGINNANIVPARLDLLIKTGKKIPRDIFDSPGRDGKPGVFQQMMTMLYGYTAIKTEVQVQTETKTNTVSPAPMVNFEVINKCDLMIGRNKVGVLDKGAILTEDMILRKEGEWVRVSVNGKEGFILNSNLLRHEN